MRLVADDSSLFPKQGKSGDQRYADGRSDHFIIELLDAAGDSHDDLFVDVIATRSEVGVFVLPCPCEQRFDGGVHDSFSVYWVAVWCH